ncbi:MAG: nitrogen regulation protein NR(II) [Anaerolineae bacterium]
MGKAVNDPSPGDGDAPLVQIPAYLPALFDRTLDLILVVDQQGNIMYANSRLWELTGLDPDEVLGRAVFELITGDERARVEQYWQAHLLEEAQALETELQRVSGGCTYCLLVASPILGTESSLFIVHDLTEAKDMQAQLVQAEKSAALGRLVAGAAHELNNPLTAVLGFAQVLREETEDEKVQEDLDRIIRGALRARDVIQDLLAFARQDRPVRSDVDLNETLTDALDHVSDRARRSNTSLQIELEPTLPAVWANAHQLRLVWDNMLTNACQAMAPNRGGTLHVSSERIGDVVRVTISDTGPGIPRDHIAHIFDPFFTTKGVGEGVGLGLSLCQGIIESNGGQIWVESTEGEGATFVVDLPISAKTGTVISDQ